MKKLLFVLGVLAMGFARADNTITSREYVDAQVNTLQSELPAKNTDAVLTHTGTAGEIGEKKIYNANNSYGAQTDALVTAGTFNSAVQNALASEFVCTEWQGDVHDNAHCLLYEVRGATQNRIQTLPIGYTQLEYIELTGTQYIRLRTLPNASNFKISADLLHTTGTNEQVFFAPGSGVQYLYTTSWWRVWRNGLDGYTIGDISNRYTFTINLTDSGVEYYVNGVKATNIPENLFTSRLVWNAKYYYLGARTATVADYLWHGKIYSFSVYADDVLFINLVPAQNSGGVVGMYDTVSNTFFTNAGTGEFIAGPAGNSNLYLPSGN